MKLQRTVALIAYLTVLAAPSLHASPVVTNFAVNAALVDDGWRFTSVDSASDGFYINNKNASIQSPVFDFTITQAVINAKRNESTTRKFYLNSDGRQFPELTVDYRDHAFYFDPADRVDSLKIYTKNESGSERVYFKSITLRGFRGAPEPEELGVTASAGSCRVSWVSADSIVSNRVAVYRCEQVDGETEISRIGLDGLKASPSGNNLNSCTNELPQWYPELSGVYLYAATNANGILQISSGSKAGWLRHSGFADYTGMKVVIRAARHVSDPNSDLPIVYVAGGDPVAITNFALQVEFADYEADLSAVPPGAELVFHHGTVDSNRRVLIDEITFVRKGRTAETFVKGTPVSGGGTRSAKIVGLEPGVVYRVGVTAYGVGGESEEVKSGMFTVDRPSGTMMIIE